MVLVHETWCTLFKFGPIMVLARVCQDNRRWCPRNVEASRRAGIPSHKWIANVSICILYHNILLGFHESMFDVFAHHQSCSILLTWAWASRAWVGQKWFLMSDSLTCAQRVHVKRSRVRHCICRTFCKTPCWRNHFIEFVPRRAPHECVMTLVHLRIPYI